MDKIKEIIIGTNNEGKYKEICNLLPNKVRKYSPKEFDISSPEETGKTFKENSFLKASYFSIALLINEDDLHQDLEAFFAKDVFDPKEIDNLLRKKNVFNRFYF